MKSQMKAIFSQVVDKNQKGIFSFLDLKELFSFSDSFDFQTSSQSFAFRALTLARHLAKFIIDDDGDLILDRVDYCIEQLKIAPFVLAPNNSNDTLIVSHLKFILTHLSQDKKIHHRIKKISLPLCHKKAEEIVRQTLLLNDGIKLTKADVKRACLCALFCPLRQSVGSCFATAPALMVQQNYPLLFLEDLDQLLSSGSLIRSFAGVQYVVPLNTANAIGELKKGIDLIDLNRLILLPSLIRAFESSGLVDSLDPLDKKQEKIQKIIFPYLEKRTVFNIYELIDRALLDHFELKEEDFISQKRLEKTEVFSQSSYHPQGLMYQHSEKKDHIKKYNEAKKRGISAFLSTTQCSLLLSWEFTLASLCDVKLEFTKWNLYFSLGFSSEEKEGVGGFLYFEIESRLKNANKLLEKYNEEVEIASNKLRTVEAVLYRTHNSLEETRLRLEAQAYANSVQNFLIERDQVYKKAQGYASLYSYLINQYMDLLQDHFQEVYDAEMMDFPMFDYNDTPAGFRLVYTHGRKDPLQWSAIENESEFIDALRSFFIATESKVIADFDNELVRPEIADIITMIIQHVQTKTFIDECLKRVSKTHEKVLTGSAKEFKDKIMQKPWGYISGGTIETVLKTYFKILKTPTKKEKLIENGSDLFFFLVEMMKSLDFEIKKEVIENSRTSFLIFNDLHVCLFYPGWEFFKNGWYTEKDPNSWLMTHLIGPCESFISKITIDTAYQKILIEKYLASFPKSVVDQVISSFFPTEKSFAIHEFKNQLISILKSVFKTSHTLPNLDGFFYKSLLLQRKPLKEHALEVLENLIFIDEEKKSKATACLQNMRFNDRMCARDFQDLIKTCVLVAYDSVCLPFDYHEKIIQEMEKLGLIYPRPILFADTNWPCYYLGFLVNPTTVELEIWRFDFVTLEGQPMNEWPIQGSLWSVFLERLTGI